MVGIQIENLGGCDRIIEKQYSFMWTRTIYSWNAALRKIILKFSFCINDSVNFYKNILFSLGGWINLFRDPDNEVCRIRREQNSLYFLTAKLIKDRKLLDFT